MQWFLLKKAQPANHKMDYLVNVVDLGGFLS